jgi:hypothetical protein
MCVNVFQDKKKRKCVAGSLYIIKLNTCNKVKNDKNVGIKHGSYDRVLQKRRSYNLCGEKVL